MKTGNLPRFAVVIGVCAPASRSAALAATAVPLRESILALSRQGRVLWSTDAADILIHALGLTAGTGGRQLPEAVTQALWGCLPKERTRAATVALPEHVAGVPGRLTWNLARPQQLLLHLWQDFDPYAGVAPQWWDLLDRLQSDS